MKKGTTLKKTVETQEKGTKLEKNSPILFSISKAFSKSNKLIMANFPACKLNEQVMTYCINNQIHTLL